MTNVSSDTCLSKNCSCQTDALALLVKKRELGMDSNFGEVTLYSCRKCGCYWLKYLHENEAFTASGQWYLGRLTDKQADTLTAEDAKQTLEGLEWYYCGGSYFDGKVSKSSGKIYL